MRRAMTGVIVSALIVAACGTSGDPAALIGIDEDQLASAEEYFAGLDAEAEAFAELQDSSIDDQAIRGFLEAHYSPNIVFDDATFGDHSEGYDEVAAMYRTFLYYFADATAAHQPTLVGDPTALIVIPFSGMTLGQWQFTDDDPLVEVDLHEMEGDRVASVTIFYDLADLQMFAEGQDLPAAVDGSFHQAYADAWTSGDISKVSALYAPNAVRHDGLARIDATGPEAIAGEVARWFKLLPGAKWAIQVPFAETYGEHAGAVFSIDYNRCTVQIGLVFHLNDAAQITQELVHYDPASLRACGWVG